MIVVSCRQVDKAHATELRKLGCVSRKRDSWQGFLIDEIFYRRAGCKSRGIKGGKRERERERERERSVLYHSPGTFIRKSQSARNKRRSCSYGRTQSNGAQAAAVLDDEWTEIDDSSWVDWAKNWREDINNGSFSRGNFNRWIRTSKIYQTSSETCDLIRMYIPSNGVVHTWWQPRRARWENIWLSCEKQSLLDRLDLLRKNSPRTSIKMLKPRSGTWQSADVRARWPRLRRAKACSFWNASRAQQVERNEVIWQHFVPVRWPRYTGNRRKEIPERSIMSRMVHIVHFLLRFLFLFLFFSFVVSLSLFLSMLSFVLESHIERYEAENFT